MIWKGKVDRQCIERLKNFQNPPLLVGYMMEMVMTLIGIFYFILGIFNYF